MPKRKKWDREEVLSRLMRIAEEARRATFSPKVLKSGEESVEYDVRCASVELKAIEDAVRISGMLTEREPEVTVRIEGEAKEWAE